MAIAKKDKKRGSSTGYLAEGPKASSKKPRPEFSLTEKDLPEIKEWNVGKKYKITLEVEMVSQSKGEQYAYPEETKKEINGRFKILSAETGESDEE